MQRRGLWVKKILVGTEGPWGHRRNLWARKMVVAKKNNCGQERYLWVRKRFAGKEVACGQVRSLNRARKIFEVGKKHTRSEEIRYLKLVRKTLEGKYLSLYKLYSIENASGEFMRIKMTHPVDLQLMRNCLDYQTFFSSGTGVCNNDLQTISHKLTIWLFE